jgi:hypothetical protein
MSIWSWWHVYLVVPVSGAVRLAGRCSWASRPVPPHVAIRQWMRSGLRGFRPLWPATETKIRVRGGASAEDLPLQTLSAPVRRSLVTLGEPLNYVEPGLPGELASKEVCING